MHEDHLQNITPAYVETLTVKDLATDSPRKAMRVQVYANEIILSEPITKQELRRIPTRGITIKKNYLISSVILSATDGSRYRFYLGRNIDPNDKIVGSNPLSSFIDFFINIGNSRQFIKAVHWSANPTQLFDEQPITDRNSLSQ